MGPKKDSSRTADVTGKTADMLPSERYKTQWQNFQDSVVSLGLPEFNQITFIDPQTTIFAYRTYIG